MAQRSESLPDPLQSPESNPELVAKGEQQAQAAVKAAGLTPDEVETVAVEAPSGPVEMPKADTPLVVAEYTTDEALLKITPTCSQANANARLPLPCAWSSSCSP